MDIFLDAPQGHEAYNKAMLGAAQGTRTELMRQMALPQNRRTGAWAGASDEELKKTMIGARRTQKNIEGLLGKNAKRRRLKEQTELNEIRGLLKGKLAKRLGVGALSAALVVSPTTVMSRTTIPAQVGSDGSPALIQKGTPSTPGKATGKFVISAERDLKTGKPRSDSSSPSGLRRGADQMEIDDADVALRHSVPGSLTHTQAQAAIANAKPTPGTPDVVLRPAVPARPDLPSRNIFSRSLTLIPNQSEYPTSSGMPQVQQGNAFSGNRRRRGERMGGGNGESGGPLVGTSGGGSGRAGGSRTISPRPFPTPPVDPTPVLGRIMTGTRSTNLRRTVRGSNFDTGAAIVGSSDNTVLRQKVAAARGEQVAGSVGLSTPVVGTMKARKVSSMSRPRPKARFEESVEHYKGILNEMIPNAERFGSRMGLARHQAARMKRVIDAHNADVATKSFTNQGASEVAPWHERELAGRAERIKSIAQAHGANLGFKGTPSTRQSAYAKTQPSEVQLAQLDFRGKPEATVDFSRLSDEQRQEGQKQADMIRKTGLADRKVKARQEAQYRERARISNAFTFEQ